MEIVSLDGQLALKVSLQKPYIHIKRYEPYGEEVEDATIATITEDMYVDWEVSERYDNIEELISSYREYSNYGFYTDDDVSKYRNLIRWQDDFGELEPNKTYYDNRIFVDAENKKIFSSKLIEYDADSSQQIPQKSKKLPFWIEVHCSETKSISIHICFRINIDKVSEKDIYFVLDAESKYIFPEANRILIILVQSEVLKIQKEETRKEFKNFIDEYRIKKAFGLIVSKTGEYNIWKGEGDAYTICPIDIHNGEVIVKKFPEDISIFNDYALTFRRCVFELEKENKKCDLRLMGTVTNNSVVKVIEFDTCIFKVDVSVRTAFYEKISFTDSIFECPASFVGTHFYGGADFQSATFKKGADFHKALFGAETIANEHKNEQSDNPKSSFFAVTFESGVHFESVHFYHKVIFSSTKFKKEAQFYNTTFEQQASFSEATFSDYASFNHTKFFGKANFLNTLFEGETYFTGSLFKQNACFINVTFHGNANFDHVEFQAENDSQDIADFSKAHFKERAFFTKTHFHKMANFSNVIFDHNAYFDEVEFLGEAKFKQSEFYMNAHFYGTIFKEIPQRDNITMNDIPNFLQIILNGYINLTNTNTKQLLLSFEQLKSIIDGDNDKEKDELANEFRNTFKNFKNGLIKDNNLIDASQFHKMELYAKELEINYKKEKAAKDWAERIQLYCYRLTSDHHTDLLLILNNVVCLIALFGVANLVLLVSQCDIIQLAFLKINYIKLLEVSICIIYVSLIVCIMLNRCSIIHFVIFLPIFSLVFYLHPTYVIFMVLTFCVLILYLMLLSCFQSKLKENLVKQCIFGVSYFIVILMFIFKPSLLIPILGKLIENKSSKSCCCDDFDIFEIYLNMTSFPSETLNLIYMLLLFLLLFSLQKTARKNTIVPN